MSTTETAAIPMIRVKHLHDVSAGQDSDWSDISGNAPSPIPQLPFNLFKAAFEASGTATLICANAAGCLTIAYANTAVLALTGYTAAELYSRPWSFLLKRDAGEQHLERLSEVLRVGKPAEGALRCLRKNGSEFPTELKTAAIRAADGEITHYVISMRDITEDHRRHELLKYFADHDSLTGLPNRRVLLDRFDQAIERYRGCGEGFTIAFVDLNRFKEINDEFGHATGDEVLRHVAECLRSSVRACDTVARLGGDEFVLLLTGTSDEPVAHHVLQRALHFLEQPLVLNGRAIKVACSIGVAFCPRDGEEAGTLLSGADGAMYCAKNVNRRESCVYGL